MASIQLQSTTIQLHLDPCGNLYFEANNKTYQLCIDRHDEPYLDDFECDIISEPETEIHHGLIQDTSEFNDDKIYVEENGHTFTHHVEDELEDTEFYDIDQYFVIYDRDSKTKIKPRKNGDILALYDTFIYDDSCSGNNLMLSSKINTENSIYRIVVMTSGKIYCRLMCNTFETQYKLVFENEQLKLAK